MEIRSRRHIQFYASLFLAGKVFAFGRRAFRIYHDSIRLLAGPSLPVD
jgi:hypothetical protein